MDSPPPTFSVLLRRFRLASGLSQQELAERASLSVRGVSDLERGLRRAPRPATVARLGAALGLGAEDHTQLAAAMRHARGRSAQARQQARQPQRPERGTSLPTPLTTFIGRDDDIAQVRALVEQRRLVTVAGPPGIGKSRLALGVARGLGEAFPDGIGWVELAPLRDGVLVVNAVAASIEVRENAGQPLVQSLVEQLAGRVALLVIDNCEHLLAACAELVSTLLVSCPALHILATSRQSLGITGETTYRLPPLGVPDEAAALDSIVASDAVRLLIDRASAVASSFAVGPLNAVAVARVCRRLDGIPLAIELAAAWVRALNIEHIADRLEDRLGVLTTGNTAAPTRHQAMRSALEWSYELLGEHERIVLNRVAVFAGGWTLEAAEAVTSGDGIEAANVLALLAALVDKSLVLFDESGGGRYRLLETLREYAAERLAEAGEAARQRERHRLWCLELAERGAREIWRADQLAWVQRLGRELDNLRAALGWTLAGPVDPEPGLRIAAAMVRWWDTRGDVRDGCRWLRDLLALPAVRPRTPAWGAALTALGYLTSLQGNLSEAVRLLDTSLGYWRELGDPRALALAVYFRGIAVGYTASDTAALPFFEQSLALSRVRGPRWVTCFSLLSLGEGARTQGDFARAEMLLGESLKLVQHEGERQGAFYTLNSLALVALAQGDADQAHTHGVQALTAAFELGNTHGTTTAIETLAIVQAARGRPRQAARLFGAAEASRSMIGEVAIATARPDRERGRAAARAQLDTAIFDRELAAGRTLTLERAVAEARAPDPVPSGRARGLLSPRELEVLRLVADGRTNREVAAALVITEATVKRHLDNVFSKLGVSTRAAATAAALRAGLA